MYFDQAGISLVEPEAACGINKYSMVPIADDLILAEEAVSTDPFMDYVTLDDTVADCHLPRAPYLSPSANNTPFVNGNPRYQQL
jgi:hypothetical protein